LECFHIVHSRLMTAELSIRDKLPPSVMQDLLGRFRLWVGNIGAHRRGRASLDYKLREASHIRNRVIELLQSLELVLHEIEEIITGDRVPWEDLSDSDSDVSETTSYGVDEELPSELAQLASNIVEVTTCLMRLSLAIRNPAPHDQFRESSNTDVAHFEPFDIDHVRGKFPFASQYLALRLGKAISRRRQYIRYREEHRRKLEQGLDLQSPLHELTAPYHIAPTIAAPSENIESTRASSLPPALKASALVSDLDEGDYEDTLSQTSFASSNNDPSKLRPPPLPENGRDGEPFECPVCYRVTSVRQPTAWHKHVYRDLQPYVCTFADCKVPDRTYESRHEWFQHELLAHRKWWECVAGCNVRFDSRDSFSEHLTRKHEELTNNERMDDLVRNCEREQSMDAEACCQLCHTKLASLAQLRRHLGKHHESLSLFALPPRLRGENEDNDAEDSDIEIRSMSSNAGGEDVLSSERFPKVYIENLADLALWTLERSESSHTWEDVMPLQQHVSTKKIEDIIAKFDQNGNDLKTMLDQIPSYKCRRLINHLVEDQTKQLQKTEGMLKYCIVAIELEWVPHIRGNEEKVALERVNVLLQSVPSDQTRAFEDRSNFSSPGPPSEFESSKRAGIHSLSESDSRWWEAEQRAEEEGHQNLLAVIEDDDEKEDVDNGKRSMTSEPGSNLSPAQEHPIITCHQCGMVLGDEPESLITHLNDVHGKSVLRALDLSEAVPPYMKDRDLHAPAMSDEPLSSSVVQGYKGTGELADFEPARTAQGLLTLHADGSFRLAFRSFAYKYSLSDVRCIEYRGSILAIAGAVENRLFTIFIRTPNATDAKVLIAAIHDIQPMLKLVHMPDFVSSMEDVKSDAAGQKVEKTTRPVGKKTNNPPTRSDGAGVGKGRWIVRYVYPCNCDVLADSDSSLSHQDGKPMILFF
jgi:hypothetical protein